ncbi:STAS/SEC14 domain-containing protein [Uliginosibacterium sp. 31-12]|uniref:STAS/SEC14 domain-containing protein n=1 Tax=Uliginosibacterium sp. 31-12 TaxID=3062781 RepID=UPI0026E32E5C|nr:STAS/SEC14 domain-containing protein [Uliginosibacterium sp. 31-12]MDO6387595.1 STAS/SEC14 domain-containing protein [Uliginosibacterium sp. 31-12]
MITTDVLPDRVEMRAYGTLTLADCKTFEELSDYRVRFNHPVDLLIDLRSMTSCSLDVAMEEWRYVRAHQSDFGKIALLTDDQLVSWSAWVSQFFTEADIRIFESERSARRWLDKDSQLEDLADGELH